VSREPRGSRDAWRRGQGGPATSIRVKALASTLAILTAGALGWSQTLPDPAWPDLQPAWATHVCPPRDDPPVALTDAERERLAMRARYRSVMPIFFAKVEALPAEVLLMPVEGVRVAHIRDTWQAPRGGGRRHEGQDIFAPRGTTVRSATVGFVYRIDDLSLGGLSVTVIGDGFERFFYTHLDAVSPDLREGQRVTTDTVLGFVGSSGNAAGTPPHLHFGVYGGDPYACGWTASDPLPRLRDRD
jgi:peptidoglycan LD-endopeptidase LytH